MAKFQNRKLKLLIMGETWSKIIQLSTMITKCQKYFNYILAHTGWNVYAAKDTS